MGTITATHKEEAAKTGQLVEMNWDPITRIVGSLGIFTKIDFGNAEGGGVSQHVFDLPRLQHFHEGQRPAGRAFHYQPHLRHLRRQPCDLRDLCAEHGVRSAAAADRGVDREPGRGCRIHVRPQHLSGQPGRGGLLRADGEGHQSGSVGEGGEDGGAACGAAWITRRSARS